MFKLKIFTLQNQTGKVNFFDENVVLRVYVDLLGKKVNINP